jgi:hypothetical protein
VEIEMMIDVALVKEVKYILDLLETQLEIIKARDCKDEAMYDKIYIEIEEILREFRAYSYRCKGLKQRIQTAKKELRHGRKQNVGHSSTL